MPAKKLRLANAAFPVSGARLFRTLSKKGCFSVVQG